MLRRLRLGILNLLLGIIDQGKIKELSKELGVDRYVKVHKTESLLCALVYLNISKSDSLRDLHSALESNRYLRKICRFQCAISLSQLSRDNNGTDPAFFAGVMENLIEKAKVLGIFKRGRARSRLRTVSVDGMFIRLNKAVYEFAESGYSAMDKGIVYGAKVHTALFDRFLPISISITSGDVHDSAEFEELMDRVLNWLSSKAVVFVMDKGYYSFPRFQALVDRGISFITPMKAHGLKVGRITAILSPPNGRVVGDFVYFNPAMRDPLRLVVAEKEGKQLFLFTNLWDVEAEVVVELYEERWEIEVLNKAVKQYFKIKTLIGKSWNAFLIQVYSVFISYLLLLIFKFLCGYRGSLLSLKRVLKTSWFLPINEIKKHLSNSKDFTKRRQLKKSNGGKLMQH